MCYKCVIEKVKEEFPETNNLLIMFKVDMENPDKVSFLIAKEHNEEVAVFHEEESGNGPLNAAWMTQQIFTTLMEKKHEEDSKVAIKNLLKECGFR